MAWSELFSVVLAEAGCAGESLIRMQRDRLLACVVLKAAPSSCKGVSERSRGVDANERIPCLHRWSACFNEYPKIYQVHCVARSAVFQFEHTHQQGYIVHCSQGSCRHHAFVAADTAQ